MALEEAVQDSVIKFNYDWGRCAAPPANDIRELNASATGSTQRG